MKGENDEDKEIRPMFPRLHIKDADKGGPKAPPRNKMALYEQFSTPSQSFASGSASLFSLPLRNNCSLPSLSGHVDNCERIQFCNSISPSYLGHKIHGDHPVGVSLNKSVASDSPLSCMNSLQKYDGKDDFISDSAHGRKFSCGISQNNKNKNKLAYLESSCSLKSQNSFPKMINSTGSVELELGQNGKKQIEKHSEVTQIGRKPKEGSAQPFPGLGDMIDASSISSFENGNSKSTKAYEPLTECIRSTFVDSSKVLQSTDSQILKEHANLGDKVNLPEGSLLKPAVSEVHKCPDELESGRKGIISKTDRHKDANMYGLFDPSKKSTTDSIFSMIISPDDVLGVLGVKQYLKARTTIVQQQRIFLVQVFELHRLIKVQKLIAGSPHLLLEDNPFSNKTSLKISSLKNLQPEYVTDQPPSFVKLNHKSQKPTTAEQAEDNAAEKILVPCVDNNMSKAPLNLLSDHGHHSGITPQAPAAPKNIQSPWYSYHPSENQWLFPIISPSEGLLYKPFVGSCHPSADLMAPLYGACGLMSLNPGSKDALDARPLPASHQVVGIHSSTPLPYFFSPHGPPIMPLSLSSAVEQMSPSTKMQSDGPESHQSAGDINSAILYRSSCNLTNRISQVMSSEVADYHLSKDKELQRGMANSPFKKMKGDALTLFPGAPTVRESADQNMQVVDHQPRVIKAQPHNPRSATESAARIFKLIQEERKHL